MSSENKIARIVLVGNPNTGKSTLFNQLCGLKQKTGNFPGVTVDKKIGWLSNSNKKIQVIDLPGINSLRPNSPDEELVSEFLLGEDQITRNDLVIVVASAKELKKSLFVADQIRDLNLNMILALTMGDISDKRGIKIDLEMIKDYFGCPAFLLSRNRKNNSAILSKINKVSEVSCAMREAKYLTKDDLAELNRIGIQWNRDFYKNFLRFTNLQSGVDEKKDSQISRRNLRQNEAILRYRAIDELITKSAVNSEVRSKLTEKFDAFLLHPFFGYLFFAVLLLIIFQAVFWLAAYPMEWIDEGFANFSNYLSDQLPTGYFFELISQGLIPGIGGVLIFLPQIAILFLLFALLEETGYMQRVVVLSDRIMQKFGMSGKSIIPLVSGMACAIPAIMSARTIKNKKERLITILVTPLMTCSARIPVYVILIAIIIPSTTVGAFNLQGLVLMGMYMFGILIAILSAYVLKLVIKSKENSTFIEELPDYLLPDIRSIGIYVWDKCRSFLFNAGKIIVAASLILYVLATTGSAVKENDLALDVKEINIEDSYLGKIGKTIEPVIEPLGYDWKIGIALISSIAAREVFVGTLATIYSIENEDEMAIKNRLMVQKKPNSNDLVYSFATCISLLLFYAFALQCISTIAITYKETNSIKWTSIQFTYMLVLAYFSALIAYQILK